MKQRNLQKFIFIAIFVLLLVLVFNLFNVFGLKSGIGSRLIEVKELAKPAELEMTIIQTECDECFSIDDVIDTLKGSYINITKELTLNSSSEEAKALIDKYNIEKLPTIILKGEINKTSIQNFRQEDDALLFSGVNPPYVDSNTGDIIGKISIIIIADKNCDVCIDFDSTVQSIKQSGVFISQERQVELASAEAKQLITKYNIQKIPALLLSTDIDAYTDIAQNLKQTGVEAKYGYYVLESQAPYVEADTGKLRGLVTLIMITDDFCQECYDVGIHKQILSQFGMAMDEEKTIDINSAEGIQLRLKYNLKKVPTIILTDDVGIYIEFVQVWQQVGTVEDDGAYVFRELDAMGVVYKDLLTSEVIS